MGFRVNIPAYLPGKVSTSEHISGIIPPFKKNSIACDLKKEEWFGMYIKENPGAAYLNERFNEISQRDLKAFDVPEYFVHWLFADRLKARGARQEMSFHYFEGPGHLAKFFSWHVNSKFDFFTENALLSQWARHSFERDMAVFERYDISVQQGLVEKLSRYNAQDQMLIHAYPVPERQQVKIMLDFGAGHGRLANLAFSETSDIPKVETYIAVDAIPSTYFTQAYYFEGLGLKVWDYFDHCDDANLSPEKFTDLFGKYDVIHLPTWKINLLPEKSVDLISCVQVLKELPGELVANIIPVFGRLVTDCGAVYIRDHLQHHNPNHMPIDLLLGANGFVLEFAPLLKDRREIHGLPRIWRKVDPDLYLDTEPR